MRTATVRWVGGEEFLATMPSGQAVTFDAAGDHKTGPGPMEALLGALGACTSVDVVMVLQKKRQKLTSLEVRRFRRTRAETAASVDPNRDGVPAERHSRRKSGARCDRFEPDEILFGGGDAGEDRENYVSLRNSSFQLKKYPRKFRVLACHAGARLHTIGGLLLTDGECHGTTHCSENHGSGRIRSAARHEQFRPGKDHGHHGRMDPHAHGHPRAALCRSRRRVVASRHRSGKETAGGERHLARRHRHDRCRNRHAGHVVSRHRLPDSGPPRRDESVGLRSFRRVFGICVCADGGRAIRRLGRAQKSAGDRQRRDDFDPRFQGSRHLRAVWRRRGRCAGRAGHFAIRKAFSISSTTWTGPAAAIFTCRPAGR